MSNIMLSAFADEYADSFEEQLRALSYFDIGNVELRHLDGKNISVLTPPEMREAKRMLDAHGISVSAIGSPLGKIALDGDLDAHLETARHIFEAANLFETRYVRLFSFYAPVGMNIAKMKSEVMSALERLVLLAREYGVTLCHENEALIYGDIPSRCKEIVDHFGGEVKCVFDMGNFVLEGVDPLSAYEILKDDIAYFHIKDALSEGAIVPAGCGDAKIREILDAHLTRARENFYISLEPHLQTFSGLNALVGRTFTNPYRYEDAKTAFTDAVEKLRRLI